MPTHTGSPAGTLGLAPSSDAATPRFHRFAPRPLAYSDPRSASQLPPFARARRFLEHVAAQDEVQWDALRERVGELPELDESRERHLHSMFVTPARQSARDALVCEAERVCRYAARFGRVEMFHAASLSRRVACAALALVLRDLLPPELFELAYGPFSAESVSREAQHAMYLTD